MIKENNNQYWCDRWDNNDVNSFNQQEPNQFLTKHLPTFNLQSGQTCIVPLCGISIDMIYLASLKIKVIGIEISETAVKSFFNKHQIPYTILSTPNNHTIYCSENINIIISDIFKITKDDFITKSSLWYDRGGYIALPLYLRPDYANKMHELCQFDTKVLLITSVHDGDQDNPAFSITEAEIQNHFNINGSYTLIDSKQRYDIPQIHLDRGRTYQTYNVYNANLD